MRLRVSIDGPTAAGKSTLGNWLADVSSAVFVDTGWTFRAVALAVVRLGHKPRPDDLEDIMSRIEHRPRGRPTEEAVLLDGISVTHLIWSERCNGVLPWISQSPTARDLILRFHRTLIGDEPAIVAGRDVAATLLGEANLKVYLEAPYLVRRERRRQQIAMGGLGTPVAGATSPLDAEARAVVAADPVGVVIDTSSFDVDALRRLVWEQLKGDRDL